MRLQNNVEANRRQEQEVLHLKDLCSMKDREIMLKQQKVDRLQAEIQNLSQDLRQMISQLLVKDQTTQAFEQLNRQVQDLMSEVTEKNEKIKKLNNEKKRFYASNERLHQEGCIKDEQISQLSEKLSEEEKIKEQLEEKIVQENESKSKLQKRITDQELHICQVHENVENLKHKKVNRTTSKEVKELLQK